MVIAVSGEKLLTVEHLTKSFGELRAVDDLSFTVSEGEIVGIAGPNGSGKSTLFNSITGIPFGADSGRISFAGRPIQNLAPHLIARSGIARTFQTETDFESLSVLDNVLIGISTKGDKGGHAAHVQTAHEKIDFVGLGGDLGRPANELSVFDRKRLMIASALALRPRLLLLDEPASGLTKPEVLRTTDLIREINNSGIAVLLIEHVISLLLSVSQRLIVLNHGQILAQGDPKSVVRDPRVVEAYLGPEAQVEHTGA